MEVAVGTFAVPFTSLICTARSNNVLPGFGSGWAAHRAQKAPITRVALGGRNSSQFLPQFGGKLLRNLGTNWGQKHNTLQIFCATVEKRSANKEATGGAGSVSSGVRLEGVRKVFKSNVVLENVNWEVKQKQRVGLVGDNGAGKTTQLQIITGELEADAGVVLMPKNCKVAYLTQEFEVVMSRTVREEFYSVYTEQIEVQNNLDRVEKELGEVGEDMDRIQVLLEELAGLQAQAEAVDLYDIDRRIDIMMNNMGFTPEMGERLVESFSGGWQMRMSLGKILLQSPDLLLLDEPTNHLDLDTVEWLENYLKEQDIPMVVVSHDRAFLDQVCNRIVETERGVAHTWNGNYTAFINQKKSAITAQFIAWERQQKELARQTEMINRLSGGGQSGRAAAAKKALEKLKESEDIIEKPFVAKSRSFRFPFQERSGQIVCRVNNLTHGYDGKQLFKDACLEVERGERIAIVGPNGCGKSTFIRLLLGNEKPNKGSVELGEHNVRPQYFEQNQAEALDNTLTVQETLEYAADNWKLSEVKALLGRFNFKKDQVHKKVGFLSGGEKARLALAKFMVTPATLLVLDEPTNHLDITSKEMLEEALKNFQGTVITISHDRYFLKQIATRVIEINDGQFEAYSGDYEYYLEKNEAAAEVDQKLKVQEEEVAKANVGVRIPLPLKLA